MDAKETAHRHGQDVASGNQAGAMGDFTPEALQELMKLGVRPPQGTNAYAMVNERQEGDHHIYDLKYTNGTDNLTLRSKWGKVGDAWKIVGLEKV